MIDTTKPFFLYALCEVDYLGRARSHVGLGLRVILHKSDGSLIIHRSSKLTPMNYIGPKSSLTFTNGLLISRSKTESISIVIHEIVQYHELIEWSSDAITLRGTEAELCDKLIADANNMMGIQVKRVERELLTPVGPIDIVFTDMDNIKHCVEMKRNRISVPAVFQLYRYLSYMSSHYDCVGYLAAPSIGNNALREANKYNYKFIKVDHGI